MFLKGGELHLTKNTIIGIGVAGAILILVIIWLLVGQRAQYVTQVSVTSTPAPVVTPQVATPEAAPVATQTATPTAKTVRVLVTSAGFSPKSVEVEKEGAVIWENTDTVVHQVASTPHPIHSDYPPLNSVGTLQPGQSRSLTFPKAGTYRYHDHLNPGSTGVVVVK